MAIRRIGAHVSIAKSLDLAADRARAINANCFQIFGSSPRSWRRSTHSSATIRSFKEKVTRWDLRPVFIHGSYLLNLAGNNLVRSSSIRSLQEDLKLANRLKAQGAIFHVGSHKGKGFPKVHKQVVQAIDELLKTTKPPAQIILENAAGSKGKIGSKFSELGMIIRESGADPRLTVCLDSAHLFAAGWDLGSPQAVNQMVRQFDQEVGLERLVCLHLNDSKSKRGSTRDIHENIGHGFIGNQGLKNFINHPALITLPIILEVPGFGSEGKKVDQDNIKLTKKLSTPFTRHKFRRTRHNLLPQNPLQPLPLG